MADPSHAVQAAQQVQNSSFSLHQLWDGSLPVQDWINSGLTWVVAHFRPFFQAVRDVYKRQPFHRSQITDLLLFHHRPPR